MRQTKKVEGTKIAQAAKDLNVTSVTVRRYISEFNIETATDKNGIKVLPDMAMDELKEVRRLKEDGLTNPQVLEALEEQRSKPAKKVSTAKSKKEDKPIRAKAKDTKEKDKEEEKEKSKSETAKPGRRTKKDAVDDEEDEEEAPAASKGRKRVTRRKVEAEEEPEEVDEEDSSSDDEDGNEQGSDSQEGRLKHSLTCQTCSKTFEHLNPRLRDCLDCYRSKRKERRRGGDRHKNVIQHPLAQQVVNKMATREQTKEDKREFVREQAPVAPKPVQHAQSVTQPIIGGLKTKVRSYRKAVEETRHITSSLKRRLERPDLPEGDRRWLEQIYAYQLILHQGWRHLSEYRSNSPQQKQEE